MKKFNQIILKDNYAIFIIEPPNKKPIECLVDLEDICMLKNFYWQLKYDIRHPNLQGYIETHLKGKRIFMHKLIMPSPKNTVIDHINGNTFDNRKENLRICNQSDNTKNRTTAKNIYYNKRDDLYTVQFIIDGKIKYLCYTRDLNEAQKYADLGKKLIREGKYKQLLSTPCKCIDVQKNNKTGVLGVSIAHNKYQARYKGQYLGTFNTIEEAAQRIKQAELDYQLQNSV